MGISMKELSDEAKLALTLERQRVRKLLIPIHSALSCAIGDTDPYFPDDMTDDDIRQEDPVFWAAQHLAEVIGAAPWDDA